MQSLYILVPLALLITLLAVMLFFWAARNGQFEDLDSEGKKILFDEAAKKPMPSDDTNSQRNDSAEKFHHGDNKEND